MIRSSALALLAVTLALGMSSAIAQEAKKAAPAKAAPAQSAAAKSAKASPASPKAGPGEKVCRHKFPSGEKRTWVCKKEEPCCAWDEISYVKCGSTITGCL